MSESHTCSRESVTDCRSYYHDDGPEATMVSGAIYCVCGREFRTMDEIPTTPQDPDPEEADDDRT